MNKKILLISSILALGVSTLGVAFSSEIESAAAELLSEKYNALFLKDEGFTYVINSGAQLDSNNKTTVKKNTEINFSVNLKNGYYESYTFKVTANDNVLNKNNDGSYTVKISANTTIKVLGISSTLPEYRLGCNLADGVSINIQNKIKNIDGSFTLNQGEFEFDVLFEKSFVPTDTFTVSLNDVVLTGEDYHYSATIHENSTLTVSGVEFRSINVNMVDTELYTFSEVSGVTLRNGVGATYSNEEISFKVNKTLMAEGTMVVKNNSTTLTPTNGVYKVKSTSDIDITVEGLTQVGEIIGNRPFNVISGYRHDKHEDKKNINKVGGFTKSYVYSGEWNSQNQLSFNSTEAFKHFNLLMFSVSCAGGAYFEINTTTGSTIQSINSLAWTTIYIQKESGNIYRVYKNTLDNSGKTSNTMSGDDLLQDFTAKINGSYYVSELIAIRDETYVDPHHYLDIAPVQGATSVGDQFTLASAYRQKNCFASLDPNNYLSMEMTFVFDKNGYYNVGVGISDVKSGMIAGEPYTLLISKVSENVFSVKFGSKDFGNINIGNDLSNLLIYFQDSSAKTATATMSKFYVEDDPTVSPVSFYNVEVTGSLTHYSYTIAGQNSDNFVVTENTVLSLTVTPDPSYEETVTVNDVVQTPNNGVYLITITSDTSINISVAKTTVFSLIEGYNLTGGTNDAGKVSTFKDVDPAVEHAYKTTYKSGNDTLISSLNIASYTKLYFYIFAPNASNFIQLYSKNKGTGSSAFIIKYFGKNNDVSLVVLHQVSAGVWTMEFDSVDTRQSIIIYNNPANAANVDLGDLFFIDDYSNGMWVSDLFGSTKPNEYTCINMNMLSSKPIDNYRVTQYPTIDEDVTTVFTRTGDNSIPAASSGRTSESIPMSGYNCLFGYYLMCGACSNLRFFATGDSTYNSKDHNLGSLNVKENDLVKAKFTKVSGDTWTITLSVNGEEKISKNITITNLNEFNVYNSSSKMRCSGVFAK